MGIELMTKEKKRNLGIISFLPLIALIGTTVYHVLLFKPEVESKKMTPLATATAQHLNTLTLAYGVTGVITFVVLLYFIIHLLKIKHITVGNKMAWAVFLVVFEPLAFPVFWFLKINREPERLDVKPSIK